MSVKINDNTSIGLPLRNLIGLIGAIVIGAWFAFGVIERLNQLETKNQLFEKDLLEASVQKPIDQEQFMICLLYTSPSPRDRTRSRMPSSA